MLSSRMWLCSDAVCLGRLSVTTGLRSREAPKQCFKNIASNATSLPSFLTQPLSLSRCVSAWYGLLQCCHPDFLGSSRHRGRAEKRDLSRLSASNTSVMFRAQLEEWDVNLPHSLERTVAIRCHIFFGEPRQTDVCAGLRHQRAEVRKTWCRVERYKQCEQELKLCVGACVILCYVLSLF